MSYQVANTLFDTRAQAVQALVEKFLTADGLNDADDIREAQADPEAAADELLEDWQPELTGATWDQMSDEWNHKPEFATREELVEVIKAYEIEDDE